MILITPLLKVQCTFIFFFWFFPYSLKAILTNISKFNCQQWSKQMKACKDEGHIWRSRLSKCFAPKISHTFWATSNVKKNSSTQSLSNEEPIGKRSYSNYNLKCPKVNTYARDCSGSAWKVYPFQRKDFYWMDWILFWMLMFNGNITMRNLSQFRLCFLYCD